MTIPEKQKAWIYKEYGPKENLSLTEINVEVPTEHQVLVKAHAASLNPIDYKRRLGYLKEKENPPPTVPGYDIAGVVVKVGSSVTSFKVGDRVYGDASELPIQAKNLGTLTQYSAVDEKLLDVIPERLSFEQAGSLPLALLTAYQSLERGNLQEGKTVLILGGSGGVGSLAVQLAKHYFKAPLVAATASGPKVDFVKSLGADVVIDYKKESLDDHTTKYDVVFDTVGKGESLKVLKEGGSAVTIAAQPQPPEVRNTVTSKGSDLKKLSPFFGDGTLKPIIDSVYKFEDVVKAFEYLEQGRATGKVVIAPIE